MRVVELFAGVGGFRIGLERYNKELFNTVFFNQWEPSYKLQFAYDCYVKNFKLDSIDEKLRKYTNFDVHEVPKEILPDFDLLVGGFPCQDYSVAHSLSTSKGIDGKKGILWWDIRATLEEKNPKYVLLENVDRLLKSPSKQRGRDFGIILKCFDELDYNLEWCVINASEHEEPQKRRRTFIFAHKKNINANNFFSQFTKENFIGKERETTIKDKSIVDISDNFNFPFENFGTMNDGVIKTQKYKAIHKENQNTLSSILENIEDEKYYIKDESKWITLKGSKKIERKTKEGFTYTFSEGTCPYPDNLEVPARTMLTSEGTINRSSHVVLDLLTNRKRILVPLECERIQTFPDNWTKYGVDEQGKEYELSDRQRYFLMGNALVTNLITKMASKLEEIEKENQ